MTSSTICQRRATWRLQTPFHHDEEEANLLAVFRYQNVDREHPEGQLIILDVAMWTKVVLLHLSHLREETQWHGIGHDLIDKVIIGLASFDKTKRTARTKSQTHHTLLIMYFWLALNIYPARPFRDTVSKKERDLLCTGKSRDTFRASKPHTPAP